MYNIDSFSTQAPHDDEIVYHFRTEEDVLRFVSYLRYGSASDRPVYTNSLGFCNTASDDTIANEIFRIQRLYRKETGLRIRGEIVTISKDELHQVQQYYEICMIADRVATLFFYSGFQTLYAVFDQGKQYQIIYGINPVSFATGQKYRHNRGDVWIMQMNFLAFVLSEVTGLSSSNKNFDLRILEYY